MRLSVPERVGGVAGAVFVTDEPVESGGAEAVLAARALEAFVAQTGAVDVVALGAVLTVAFMSALRPVRPHGALVLAPGGQNTRRQLQGNINVNQRLSFLILFVKNKRQQEKRIGESQTPC